MRYPFFLLTRSIFSPLFLLFILLFIACAEQPDIPPRNNYLNHPPVSIDISDQYIFVAESGTGGGITILDRSTLTVAKQIHQYNDNIVFDNARYIKYIPEKNLIVYADSTNEPKLFTVIYEPSDTRVYNLEFAYIINGIDTILDNDPNPDIIDLIWASGRAGNGYEVSYNKYDITNIFEPYITIYAEITPYMTRGCTTTEDYFIGAMEQWGIYIVQKNDQLTHIASLDTPGSATDVAYKGGYIFVADAYRGLQVIDANDIAHPILLETAERETSGEATSIDIYDKYLALASGTGGVYIYDISIPQAPVQIDRYLFSVIGRPTQVKFYQNHLYIARTTNSSVSTNAILCYTF